MRKILCEATDCENYLPDKVSKEQGNHQCNLDLCSISARHQCFHYAKRKTAPADEETKIYDKMNKQIGYVGCGLNKAQEAGRRDKLKAYEKIIKLAKQGLKIALAKEELYTAEKEKQEAAAKDKELRGEAERKRIRELIKETAEEVGMEVPVLRGNKLK